MKIRLIAMDLDGTTLNKNGRLATETGEAILAAIECGIEVVIASGRSFSSLPEEVLSLPGIRYAIVSNGASVYRISDGACVHRVLMREQDVCSIVERFRESGCPYEVFIDGVAYANRSFVEDPVRFGAAESSVPYIQRTRNPIADDEMEAFILKNRAVLDSLDVVIRDDSQREEVIQTLSELDAELYVTTSIKHLVEVSDAKSGKDSGMRAVCDLLGIPLSETAAFGDANNDEGMLKLAGIGIAVENGTERCLRAADYVTGHHDRGGVAEAIRLILKEELFS